MLSGRTREAMLALLCTFAWMLTACAGPQKDEVPTETSVEATKEITQEAQQEASSPDAGHKEEVGSEPQTEPTPTEPADEPQTEPVDEPQTEPSSPEPPPITDAGEPTPEASVDSVPEQFTEQAPDTTSSSENVANGQFAGESMKVQDAVFFGAQTTWFITLTNFSGACKASGSQNPPVPSKVLGFTSSGVQLQAGKTYSPTQKIGPGTVGGAFIWSTASNGKQVFDATDGSLTITSYTPGQELKGTYTIKFANGSFTGKFTAKYCIPGSP